MKVNMNEVLRWDFPLPRTHTGMLQGNGTMGAMIWGSDNNLRITLNRADFWDHRGGVPWRDEVQYKVLHDLIQEGKYEELKTLFEPPEIKPGEPRQPSLLPLGRLELTFQKPYSVKTGYLHIKNGKVVVDIGNGHSNTSEVSLLMSMDKPILHCKLPQNIPTPELNILTSWDFTGDKLQEISFEKPTHFKEGNFSGWIQTRPADNPICCGILQNQNEFWVAIVYGNSPHDAKNNASKLLETTRDQGYEAFRTSIAHWWNEYWRKVPLIDIPNETLSMMYYYGVYKFAGLTNPNGVPAGLQGPWIEEYQMPPWSADYHFNINVQMCYWPAYRTNLMNHLKPLFSMIESWKEILRQNAKKFVGIDDGLIMPHAVDDRCRGMGGFWTGAIDHGCTAWVAQMMYQYYLYTQDIDFLRNTAYPFMVGAMHVYEKMLEFDGTTYKLPLSVSPEYRGSQDNAWGVNASFQLACIHFLCESLLDASKTLGIDSDKKWAHIHEHLPLAAFVPKSTWGQPGEKEIGIWENVPLEESHRHHSHLAAICPFDTIDISDPQYKKTIENSIFSWIMHGMGLWSGWCVPWASMIHTRLGNGESSELLLEIWHRVFTNEGNGTLHDPNFPGISVLGLGAVKMAKGEIMQMDAGMAATAAILEMLIHTRRGVNYLFWGAPSRWKNISFENIRTEGAFEVSAYKAAGKVGRIVVKAHAPGVFKCANPWQGKVTLQRASGQSIVSGQILELPLSADEKIELTGE